MTDMPLPSEFLGYQALFARIEADVYRKAADREAGTPYAAECHKKAAGADQNEARFNLARDRAKEVEAAAADMLSLMEDALHVHIYSDDEVIPADCSYVAAIQRMRAALGMEPAGIETVPVWAYSATFCDTNGDPASYSDEVYAPTAEKALLLGRVALDTVHRGATKVDARVVLTAGTVEG